MLQGMAAAPAVAVAGKIPEPKNGKVDVWPVSPFHMGATLTGEIVFTTMRVRRVKGTYLVWEPDNMDAIRVDVKGVGSYIFPNCDQMSRDRTINTIKANKMWDEIEYNEPEWEYGPDIHGKIVRYRKR